MEAQQAFAGLESGLDITVGEFNFFVDKDGVQDLLDPLDKETLDVDILDNASTATPSILAAPSSQIIPIQSPSDSATSMDSQEFRDKIAKRFERSEIESEYRPNNSIESLDDTIDCNDAAGNERNVDDNIYLADLNGPEIRASHEIFACDADSLDKVLEDLLDCDRNPSKQSNSNMSLDGEPNP